jgi:monoterpene epsilon-lactone hydrolase
VGPLGVADLVARSALVAIATLVRRAARGPLRPGWSARTELTAALMRHTVLRSKRKGIAWLRDAQGALPVRVAHAADVVFQPVRVAGLPGLACAPRAGAAERTLLYLHGGGYVIGSAASYRDLLARLALHGRARVVAVDYRLAPEHPFPAQQDDALAAARALLAETGPARLALGGDSAGGALCVATLCALRDAGEPLPAAALLFCPWTEPFAEGGSMERNADADFGDRELLVSWVRATGGPASDPRLTLTGAKLEGLPPLLVQLGGAELLYDQVQRFAAQARSAEVDVVLEEYPEMFHDFQLQANVLPEGAAALESAASFMRERVR